MDSGADAGAGAGAGRRWDIFCRVVDNWGDIGVCWRLATQLAMRGAQVRLIADDVSALAWMAGQAQQAVEVHTWPGPVDVADVVIEAFGCDPPAPYVQAMAAQAMAARGAAPVWINLEYLSAEAYVERSHGLPSPQRSGLIKWFFYPGFTPLTGGLLLEPGLETQRAAFDRCAWLKQQSLHWQPQERVVLLFCYGNPAPAALPSLLQSLVERPTLLLLAAGAAQEQVSTAPAGVRLARLPRLSQLEFDHALWSADLNFVRGEDSLVRAIGAGAPFVWQAYPQQDGAHLAKLEAMLAACGATPQMAQLWRAWNASPGVDWPGLPVEDAWAPARLAWRKVLLTRDDLVTQLMRFAFAKSSV